MTVRNIYDYVLKLEVDKKNNLVIYYDIYKDEREGKENILSTHDIGRILPDGTQQLLTKPNEIINYEIWKSMACRFYIRNHTKWNGAIYDFRRTNKISFDVKLVRISDAKENIVIEDLTELKPNVK